ncbi:MAG: ATP-binding protein [Actinobacteria bacterium]|nr:ATP-binding protein [Actinomycetota bacterium]
MPDKSLIDFISAVSGEEHLKVEENLGNGYVRLRTAEAERRQAKHDIRSVEDIVVEMLRNARDAGASKIFLATTKEENTRFLTFIDNGSGIPANMQKLIFEPRVTSKLESMVMDRWGVHGRGMALYSIKENSRIARVTTSKEGLGSALYINVDVETLPEKTDQSTYPVLMRNEDGTQRIGRGPHNIIRHVLEFALECRDVDVYLGSPTEVVGTLCHLGHLSLNEQDLLFCDDLDELPVYLRPSACGDATELVEMCERLGLMISERTAHRILAGEINPLRPPLNKLVPIASEPGETVIDVFKDRRGLKIAGDDLDAFGRSLESAFEELARTYYLSLKDTPKITVSKDCIRVKFDIEKDV